MSVEELRAELARKDDEIQRLKKCLHEGKDINLEIITAPETNETIKQTVTSLTNEDISRYSRQLILPEFGVRGQLKLKSSSVLIVGAGGLGCPAAIYLVAAGIGKLGVVDYDEVELSNLHRQILHTTDRVGISKSLSVTKSCFRLNPSVDYFPYKLQLNSSNALDIIQQYDIVIDATDNVATRYLLNDACVLARKPLVSGSALRLEGQLTVYNYENGPCYRCLFPNPPPPESVTNCSEGGVLGVVPGIIGSLQALEAIKIASGLQSSFSQRLLLFDAFDGTFRAVKLRPKSKLCTVCGEKPTILQLIDYEQFCGAKATDKNPDLCVLSDSYRISAKEYSNMLKNNVSHVLLDVRPAIELDICRLPHQALNIPFTNLLKNASEASSRILQALQEGTEISREQSHISSEFQSGDNKLQRSLRSQSQTLNVPVVCVCRRGNDSQLAVEILQKEAALNGIKLVDIRGGLHNWSKQIDHQFPMY